MKCIYNGRTLVVHNLFSNLVVITEPASGQKETISLSQVTLLDDNGNPLGEQPSYPEPPQLELKIGTPTPPPPIEVVNAQSPFKRPITGDTVPTDDKTPNTELSGVNGQGNIKQFNINEVKVEDVSEVSRAIPGLGRTSLNTIIANRPIEGYVDLEHLQSVNHGKIPANLRWSVIADYLSF